MSKADSCSPLVARELIPIVLREVCAAYDVTEKDLLSHRRFHALCEPRRVVWWLCRAIGCVTFERIGELTGKRNHTSVIHGCILVDQLRAKSAFHRKQIDEIWGRVLEQVEPIVGRGVLAHPAARESAA